MVAISEICSACRLCCNGSIFRTVPITSEEQQTLGDEGRYETGADGRLRMVLGCNFLAAEGGCSRYTDRPAACRVYECGLTQNVRNNVMTEVEAMLVVRNMDGYRKKLQKLCASIMPELDWPENVIGTEKLLGKNIMHYEEKIRRLSIYDHLQLISARNMYIAFVRVCFDDRFMSDLRLDTPSDK